MDAQLRLTRLDEWRAGHSYRWLKGGQLGPIFRCVGFNLSHVILEERGGALDGQRSTWSPKQWRNRFIPAWLTKDQNKS